MAQNQTVICDTNIIIELFKGNERIQNNCLAIGLENLSISSVTVGEFYYGALNKKEISLIKNHLEKFAVVPVSEPISNLFMKLMQTYCLSHKPFIGDMFIAATAIHFDVQLYTLNHKDFHFIPELTLHSPNN